MRNCTRLAAVSLLAVLALISCSGGKTYAKGDLKITLKRVEWNKIFAGPYELQGGGLVLTLHVFTREPGAMPTLPLSVKRASGELVGQGTTSARQKGTRTVIETFFLLAKTDEPLYLIAGDFDPIPIHPVDKL